MESVCEHNGSSRRESERIDKKPVRETKSTRRRQMACVGDNGVQMRRHSTVLLQPDNPGAETDKKGYSATNRRMEHTKSRGVPNLPGVSGDTTSLDVLISTGSLQPGGSVVLPRMQSLCNGRNVLFNDVVSVFEPIDWCPDDYTEARKGQWMQAAADRHRFNRRIKMTETEFGNIFSNDHRAKVFSRFAQL